jgi:hypothetical protein
MHAWYDEEWDCVRGVAAAARRALKDSWAARGDCLPLLAVLYLLLGSWRLGVGFGRLLFFGIASTVILLSSLSSGILVFSPRWFG